MTRKRRYNRTWDENLVISTIKLLEKTNYNYVRKYDESLLKAGKRFFGTWEKAVVAAGRKYDRAQ